MERGDDSDEALHKIQMEDIAVKNPIQGIPFKEISFIDPIPLSMLSRRAKRFRDGES